MALQPARAVHFDDVNIAIPFQGTLNLMAQNGYYFAQLALTVGGILAILWAARRNVLPRSPMPIWTVGLLLVVVSAFEFLTFKVSTPPDRFHDFFFAYYPAGQAMAHGDAAKLYALTERGVSGLVNIPVVAYLFAPFGMLGRQAASLSFSLLGLVALVAAWLVLVQITKPEQKGRWLLALLFLASSPLMHGFKFGNTSHFVLLGLVVALALLHRGPGPAESAVRRDLQYLLVLCLCLVSSPLTWSHYYVWLLVPIGYFFGTQPPFPSSARARVAGWFALALVTPLVGWPWTIASPTLMTAYTSFLISHLLFGGLLWFGLIAWWLAMSGRNHAAFAEGGAGERKEATLEGSRSRVAA